MQPALAHEPPVWVEGKGVAGGCGMAWSWLGCVAVERVTGCQPVLCWRTRPRRKTPAHAKASWLTR